MISEQQAVQLEQKAETSNDENEKKQLFLKSAQIYAQLSEVMGEKKYLDKADELYQKSQITKDFNIKKTALATPRYRFKDVAGMDKLKQEIAVKILYPFKFPFVYKFFNKDIGGGILMYGPPGCGKSLIAEATAGEANVNFFHVKASDVKSKYVGETEKNIAKLFEDARKNQPCIIFFDEFEALGQDRATAGKYNKGGVSQLLTEMDGVGNKNQQILLLAATNEPWNIDSALKREGRFGTTIFVPPPDKNSRASIMCQHMSKIPREQAIDYAKLSLLTENMSGADIKSIVNKAVEKTILQCLDNGKLRGIGTQDLLDAIRDIKPTLETWFAKSTRQVRFFNQQDMYPELIKYAKV